MPFYEDQSYATTHGSGVAEKALPAFPEYKYPDGMQQGRDDLYNLIHPQAESNQSSYEEDELVEKNPYLVSMHDRVIDASTYAKGSETLYQVAREFAAEDDDFNPDKNPELRQWLEEVVQREAGMEEADAIDLVDEICEDVADTRAEEEDPDDGREETVKPDTKTPASDFDLAA